MPWKAQVTSSKSALRASSPLVTSPKLTLDSFSESFIKWWPLPSSCWMDSNFSPTFLFPSRFEAKLYYILISSFKLNCWTGYHHHAAPFNILLSSTRWIENCHAFVTKILGTTFMRSYLCVTQQDKMLLLRDTQQYKYRSNDHQLRSSNVSRQIFLLWMSFNC